MIIQLWIDRFSSLQAYHLLSSGRPPRWLKNQLKTPPNCMLVKLIQNIQFEFTLYHKTTWADHQCLVKQVPRIARIARSTEFKVVFDEQMRSSHTCRELNRLHLFWCSSDWPSWSCLFGTVEQKASWFGNVCRKQRRLRSLPRSL